MQTNKTSAGRGFVSRRAVLASGSAAAVVALGGTSPGGLLAQDAGDAGGGFWFIVCNDTHCRDADDIAWMQTLTSHMNALAQTMGGIDLCLHAGDVSHDGKPEQLQIARDGLAALNMPVYTVPGNHDYATPTTREPYDAAYPDGSNFAFEHRGWLIVGLDTTEGTKYENTTIADTTLAWLDAHLPALPPAKPMVLFTHFPMGAGMHMPPLNADAVMQKFAGHNLRAVFNGHWHAVSEVINGEVSIVTNRCCSGWNRNFDNSPEKGYWLCRAENGRVFRAFVQIEGAPTGL